MRLARPYIPLAIRVEVAVRQIRETHEAPERFGRADAYYLKALLWVLFGDRKAELHHRPALVNRQRFIRNGKTFYVPPANSAEHLVYLLEEDHDIETRVRGQHGQHSDLALVRRRKRKERKAKRPKRKWPSRPLRSRGFRGASNGPGR